MTLFKINFNIDLKSKVQMKLISVDHKPTKSLRDEIKIFRGNKKTLIDLHRHVSESDNE